MHKKEKEITSREAIDSILNAAEVCRVAFAHNNEPYLVPLSFGYDGEALYFHTAQEGRKLDFIAANNRVCFEVEHNVSLITHESRACSWTAGFESVIGYGRIVEVLTPEDKVYGLNQIMRHYSGKDWQFPPESVEATRIWRVDIETLTGKASHPKK